MVEVNMREEDLPHVLVGDAVLLQARGEPVEAARWAGLDQGGSPVLAGQEERGYDLPGIHEVKVYYLYLHLRPSGLWLQAEIIQTHFVRLPARLRKRKGLCLGSQPHARAIRQNGREDRPARPGRPGRSAYGPIRPDGA